MKVQAVRFDITVQLDLDTLVPDITAEMELEPEFSFLQSNPAVLAGYLERVAKELRGTEKVNEEELDD